MANYKAVQFGIPRSGTTVVWQIANEIWNPCQKSHKMVYTELPLLITYRDPRDIVYSFWRTSHGDPDRKICHTDINDVAIQIKNIYKHYYVAEEYYKGRTNVIWFKYESFWDDICSIIGKINSVFDMNVDIHIADNFTLQKNAERANKISSFTDRDEFKIHGGHIKTPMPGAWKTHIPQEYHEMLNDILLPAKKWGGYDEE
jgi:hypothetical protein